ncbi:MAG: hypothetical protein ACRBFS_13740 [Aureispira sp.]
MLVEMLPLFITVILFFFFVPCIRKHAQRYTKVDQMTSSLENFYELALLLHANEIREKRIVFINQKDQSEVIMSIRDYLHLNDKENYLSKARSGKRLERHLFS